MVDPLLCDIIESDPAITAIIADRIHPSSSPEKLQLPKITFEHVSSDPGIDNDGVHLNRYPYQLDCWAASYKGAHDLAQAVITKLQLYRDEDVKLIVVTDCFDNDASRDQGRDKQTVFRKTIRLTISI